MASVTPVTYVGPSHAASAWARQLETSGLTVEFEPPLETKDLQSAFTLVTVIFAVTGSIPDLVACAKDFLSRHRDVRLDGLPLETGWRTVADRLAEVDELLARKVITENERDEQRDRILGEL